MIIRVSLKYLVFSALWIFLSDRILEALITNPVLLSEIQTFKGWFFVAASTALIAYLLKREQTGRKLIENELRQSRRGFQELFARNPIPMWVYDKQNLAFLAVNEAAAEAYGYSASEFLLMNLSDIRPQEESPGFNQDNRDESSTLQDTGTWRYQKKDGAFLIAHIITHTILFGGHEAVLVHAEDITGRYEIERAFQEADRQRIKAEDTLRLEEARLDALLKLNQLVEKSVDEVIAYGLEEGLRFSQSTNGFLALTAQDGSGPSHQFIHSLKLNNQDGKAATVPIPISGEMTGLIAEAVQERKPVLHNEASPNGDSGRLLDAQRSIAIPLLEDNQVALVAGLSGKQTGYDESDIRHLTLLMDGVAKIAQRKRMMEALSRSESRFRSAIESLPFDFWMKDREGRYIQQNATCIENWGNWIGKKNDEISIPDDVAARFEENDRKALQGEFVRMEMALPARGGDVRYVYTVVGPIQYQGDNQGILGMNIDITALKQREAELKMINRLSAALRDLTEEADIQALVLDQTMADFQAECASIINLDRPSGEFITGYGRGLWSMISGTRLPVADYPQLESIIRSGKPHVELEIRNSDDFGLPLPLDGCTTIAAVPLKANQQTMGLLFLGKNRQFTESELSLLESVADLSASAIHRALISEQKDLHLKRLTALRAIDMAVTASLDIRVTLNILLDQLVTQPRIDAGTVLLFSPLSQELEYAASRGFRSSIAPQVQIRPGAGVAGRVLLDRKIQFIPDLNLVSDPVITNFIHRGEAFTSYIGLPLVAKGEVKGVIEVYSRTHLNPDDEWLDFLQAVAAQAAIAIDHAEIFKQLQRSNQDLTISYDATIEGWARALEMRDPGTEGHTRRVTELTLRLAQRMGAIEDQMVHLRRGVLLHDIGKMAIPDDILLKEGPLTDDEWKIMKRHPVYAYELLSPIPYLQPAIDIPYSHHEHWDGSGYPQGLTGQDIPIASRIFSVIDVWDALRNDRPYRRAWPERRVMAYIKDQAGRLFDPEVIPPFLEQVGIEKHYNIP